MNTRFLAALALAAATVPAQQGAIRATRAQVAVEIVDGVATVELALAVQNVANRIGEAEWILPLPDGAVADGFTTRIGDAPPIQGEVLDAAKARAVYESIVRRRRDPGLLEFAGRGCLRAKLFPIPPGSDAEVKIRWRQVLPELAGLLRWSQPVAAMGVDGSPPEQVTFVVKVRSRSPIRNALSPTPGADVRLVDEHTVLSSFEPAPGQPLPKELALYYGLSDSAFGLHVLAQRDAENKDGYFTLLVAPKQDWGDAEVAPRSVTFVLDVSGSMRGQKIDQAKRALKQFLRGLRPIDRFDVVPFSTDAEPFFGRTVDATAENVESALARADAIEARGGTNLEAALRHGLPDAGPDGRCVPICVLLSDGLPTAGMTGVDDLLRLAKQTVGERHARVFVLGVGHDVHTVLLDDLAEAGRGTRQYVRPDEDIEEKASDLLVKIGRPVMTDLALSIDGAEVSRLTPSILPDLFAGSRLVVTGRYGQPGTHQVRLRGKVGDVEREFVYDAAFPTAEAGNDFVPKLWATRRVAALLDDIRRNGQHQELLDEVRQLGVEFQIVTPYTSHLVVEEALGVGVSNAPPPAGRPFGPSTPGPGGAVQPGPSGPATPGPAGPATMGGPTTGGRGGAYRGPGDVAPPQPGGGGGGGERWGRIAVEDLGTIGARLQEAGVLPKDAPSADVERLARQVAREMQASAQGLSGLGRTASGSKAVDDSVYLAQLLGGSRTFTGGDQFFLGAGKAAEKDSGAALLRLFVRRVGDKVFRLREGVWTDEAYDPKAEYAKSLQVAAFSDEYFTALREHPELARYVALSERMKIVLGDTLLEITAAPPQDEEPMPEPAKSAEGAGK